MSNKDYYNICYKDFMNMTESQFNDYSKMINIMDNVEYNAYCQAMQDR